MKILGILMILAGAGNIWFGFHGDHDFGDALADVWFGFSMVMYGGYIVAQEFWK